MPLSTSSSSCPRAIPPNAPHSLLGRGQGEGWTPTSAAPPPTLSPEGRGILIAQPTTAPAHRGEPQSGRLLRGPWGRTWLLTAVLGLVILGGWEYHWRQRSFQPSRVSDEPLWLMAREHLASSAKPVALLGASRLQVGLDLDVFAEVTGIKPEQLAICYSSPIPVLRHLAEDESFRGLVICESPNREEDALMLKKLYRGRKEKTEDPASSPVQD